MIKTVIPYISAILGLFAILFALNGCETAVTTLTPPKFKLFFQKKLNKRKVNIILKLVQNFNVTLATILCGVTIANTGWATLATLMVVKLAQKHEWIVSLTIVLLTIFVLIFAETLPKLLAKKNPAQYIWSCYWIVIALRYAFYPFVKLLSLMVWNRNIILVREREIINMINSLRNHPAIDQEERDLVISAFNFDEKVLKRILTPMAQVKKISPDLKPDHINRLFLKYKYSRMPVLDAQHQRFKGVVSFKNVFNYCLKNQKLAISDIILPIIHLAADTKLDDALKKMRVSQLHMVGVINPQSQKLLGIVTLEDILEEIVGEIYDEKDVNFKVHSVGNEEWIVKSDVKVVDFLKKQLHLKINAGWKHWTVDEWFNHFWQKKLATNPASTTKSIRYKNFSFAEETLLAPNSKSRRKFIVVAKIQPRSPVVSS